MIDAWRNCLWMYLIGSLLAIIIAAPVGRRAPCVPTSRMPAFRIRGRNTRLVKFQYSIGLPFEEMAYDQQTNISPATEQGILTILIRPDFQRRALVELGKMNINACTLFPGLDGLARSLSFHLLDWLD